MGFIMDLFKGPEAPPPPSAAMGVQNLTTNLPGYRVPAGPSPANEGNNGKALWEQPGIMGGSGMEDLVFFSQDEVAAQGRKDAIDKKGGASIYKDNPDAAAKVAPTATGTLEKSQSAVDDARAKVLQAQKELQEKQLRHKANITAVTAAQAAAGQPDTDSED